MTNQAWWTVARRTRRGDNAFHRVEDLRLTLDHALDLWLYLDTNDPETEWHVLPYTDREIGVFRQANREGYRLKSFKVHANGKLPFSVLVNGKPVPRLVKISPKFPYYDVLLEDGTLIGHVDRFSSRLLDNGKWWAYLKVHDNGKLPFSMLAKLTPTGYKGLDCFPTRKEAFEAVVSEYEKMMVNSHE